MRRKKRGLPAPIYTFALIWLGCTFFLPLLRLSAWLITAGLAVGGAAAVAVMLKKKAEETVVAEEIPEEKSTYGEAVDAVIADGKLAMGELGRLYNAIRDTEIRRRINEIMSITDRIVRDAIDDPGDVPQIRKFLDYYMPTTLKLLNAYDRMDAMEVEGENISGSKKRITEMLDTSIEAYKKHLDSLFANQAMDIDAEIRAMEGILAREGLSGKSYLDIRDYLKYDNEQKGSTQNG